MENKIHVYTDGACSGNPGPAGIGIYMEYGDNVKEISKYIGESTNNIAELMAIKVGLETLTKRDVPVVVYSDSQYCIGLLSQGWKAKANKELVAETRQLVDEFTDIEFVKVKGHSGHVGNERVDKLAVSAYEPYVTRT